MTLYESLAILINSAFESVALFSDIAPIHLAFLRQIESNVSMENLSMDDAESLYDLLSVVADNTFKRILLTQRN